MMFSKEFINNIQDFNFPNQDLVNNYKKILEIVINNLSSLIYERNIEYDFLPLKEKLKSMKLVCRNRTNPEYDDKFNILYISLTNQLDERLTDEDQIIFLIHEIIHSFCPRLETDSISDKYYAFEEFFTEYLTFYILRRIGGIKLERYYLKSKCGYFNQQDHNIILKLKEKFGFDTLLTTYFSNSAKALEKIIPKDILNSLQIYYNYFIEIYERYNIPLKRLNEMLNSELIKQNLVLQNKINRINEKIDNYNFITNHLK